MAIIRCLPKTGFGGWKIVALDTTKDRKIAAEEAQESTAWKNFNSNVGAWLGAVVSGGILYLFYCVDDVSSSLSDVWAYVLSALAF